MKINVIASHIALGEKCNGRSCPLALALQHYTGDPSAVVTSRCCVVFGKQYPLPPVASAFRYAVDSGIPVGPFSFELALQNENN